MVKIKNLISLFFLIICSISFPKAETKFLKNMYHTVEEIYGILDGLINTCKFSLSKEEISYDKTHKLYYYKLAESKSSNAPLSVFIFGEHSRELISPELGLNFIWSICSSDSPYDLDTRKAIVEQNSFIIIPIVNLPGRVVVEKGNFCKRTNENGVDLNRNWNSHWSAHYESSEEYPGAKAFSEWQTQILENILKRYHPRTFLSIHSGVLGMYIPFAYKKIDINNKSLVDMTINRLKKMVVITNKLNTKYCNCKSGPAANELWYLCPGTCLDYAFENLDIPYTFGFEIFSGNSENPFFLKMLEAEKIELFSYKNFLASNSKFGMFLQTKSKMFSKLEETLYQKHKFAWDANSGSCFSQISMKIKNETPKSDTDNYDCMKQFNPLNEKHFTNTLITWTNVLFEMVSLIHLREK